MFRRNLFSFFVLMLMCCFFAMGLFEVKVFASGHGYSYGGWGATPQTNTDTHYECNGTNNWQHCPQWIKVSKGLYDDIVRNNRVTGSYSAFPKCDGDSYVVIAGDVGYRSGLVQIYNLTTPLYNSKISRLHVGVASSSNSFYQHNFFPERNDSNVPGADGHILTYEEILQEVIADSGKPEKDIAVFCPSMVGATYYSSSNVSASSGWNGTGIVKDGDVSNDLEVNISVGDSTPITFSHDVYSSVASNNQSVKWAIHKKVYKNGSYVGREGFWGGSSYGWGHGENLDYVINNTATSTDSSGNRITISTKENASSGTIKNFSGLRTTNNGGTVYIASDRPYNDHVARDVLAWVTFKKQGTYKFCETIDVNNVSTSGACVTVNVGPKTGYLSISNVSNRNDSVSGGGSDYESTGIRDTPATARSNSIKLDNGGNVAITFSHNIFSTTKVDNVPYTIKRTINGSEGFSSDGLIKFNPVSNSNSSGGTDAGVSGYVSFYEQSQNYFIGNPRRYADSDDSRNRYVLRDYYDVVFEKHDGTYDICETVYVGSGENMVELTSSCSKITVGNGGDCTGPNCDDCVGPNCSSDTPCGVWTPDSYKSSTERDGTTSVKSAVKNVTLGQDWTVSNGKLDESGFNDISKAVWAKPYDSIDWRHCYYPGAQKVAYENATKDNHHPEPSRVGGNYNSLNNIKMKDYSGWENWYRVTNRKLTDNNNYFESFRIGSSDIRQWDDNYSVLSGNNSRAGMILTEKNTASKPKNAWANTSDGIHSWSCNAYKCNCVTTCSESGSCSTSCSTCYETCYHRQEFFRNGTTMENAVDVAMVMVPYNFENRAEIRITPTTTYEGIPSVYAGETVIIENMDIFVGQRDNSVTDGTYATTVDNGRVKLIAYTSTSGEGSAHVNVGNYDSNLCKEIDAPITHENCEIIDDKVGQRFNYPEDPYPTGVTDRYFTNAQYNVYDVAAGEYYCVAGAVYPYTVNGDTDMNASGSDTWYISKPSCVKIAKRPSFQVWGNSMYTSGEITTEPGTKRVIAGFHPFNSAYNGVSASSRENTTIFGSWVEQSLVTPFSSVSGLASGAATGYYASNPGVFKSRSDVSLLGGSHEGSGKSFCLRVPLTIPNTSCNGDTGIVSGNGSNSMSKPSDKSALVSRFSDSTSPNYTFRSDVRSLGDTVVPKGETWVYSSSEDFEINGNIVYEAIGYQNMVEIPKLIIHARNIKIDCKVKRVDAVLIADDNVKTCSGSSDSDDNALSNANQLKVFGSVITNTLTLNRSYGAASGTYNYDEQMNNNNQRGNTSGQEQNYSITGGSAASVVPAEIVDYDTSLYLWGMPRANAGTSGKLDITYQTELAPRF